MTLLERILDHQSIVISLGIVLLPLALATLISSILQLRKFINALAVRRENRRILAEVRAAEIREARQMQQAAQQQMQAAAGTGEPMATAIGQSPVTNTDTVPQNQQASPSNISTNTSTAPAAPQVQAGPGQPAIEQGAAAPQAAEPTEEAQPEQEGSSEDDAMQNLLSSVFDDDEAQALYAVLLSDTQDIPAAELAALCDQIAGQMGARVATTVAE